MDTFLQQFWPWMIAGLDLLMATVTTSHAVLHKRDSRAAAGWVGLIWLAPFAGSMLYIWLGINRIERKAHRLRPAELADEISRRAADRGQTESECELHCGHLQSLAELVGRMTGQPLCSGNQVTCLPDGDAAYSAMLAAIDNATTSISLCVYIFANDRAGRVFAESLIRASNRSVIVRVLVDDVGSGYSWRSGTDLFEDSSVTVARLLPTLTPWRFQYSNLRNHRKVLVVDGEIGFTGGMNICEVNFRDVAGRIDVICTAVTSLSRSAIPTSRASSCRMLPSLALIAANCTTSSSGVEISGSSGRITCDNLSMIQTTGNSVQIITVSGIASRIETRSLHQSIAISGHDAENRERHLFWLALQATRVWWFQRATAGRPACHLVKK